MKTRAVKGTTKTLHAVKSACKAVKKNFSSGTNEMAELWIKEESKKNPHKTQMLKKQSLGMLKNMTTDFKNSFKGVSGNDVICDISYELGGVLKKTKETFHEYIDDIKRIPIRKCKI